jgi:hypothetical protein
MFDVRIKEVPARRYSSRMANASTTVSDTQCDFPEILAWALQ